MTLFSLLLTLNIVYICTLYLTLRPELAVIGLAVIAVLGVLNACSIDWDIAA